REMEGAADPHLAGRPDAAAVRLDDPARDVETDAPGPAITARFVEGLEDRRELHLRDADAGVDDRDQAVGIEACRGDADRAARRGELDRVFDQVGDHVERLWRVAV